MRKKILLAVSLLILAGCDESGKIGPEPDSTEREITFSQPLVSISTRSDEGVSEFPSNQFFTVYGRKYSGNYTTWDAGQRYVFDKSEIPQGVKVGYVSGYDVWKPVPQEKFYWPKDDSKLAFLACAPAAIESYSSDDEPQSASAVFTDAGLVVTNYAPKSNISEGNNVFDPGEPLLYSNPLIGQTMVDDQMTGEALPVNITFRHALAKVGCTVKCVAKPETVRKVELRSLYIENLATTGDFSQNLPLSGEGPGLTGTPSWSLRYSLDNTTCQFLQFDNLELTENQQEAPFAYVLPQNFDQYPHNSGETILGLVYDVYVEDRTNADRHYSTALLHDIFPEGEWKFEMGKEYIIDIVINLSENDLTFKPTIADWVPTQGRQVNIVR